VFVTEVAVGARRLAQHSMPMAHRIRGLEEFLDFASTPAWRSAVLFAAVAFAGFHLIALLTPPLDLDGSADTLNALQLLNLVAVLARFAAPLGFLIKGLRDSQKLRLVARDRPILRASH
jgi:hypothetical protein